MALICEIGFRIFQSLRCYSLGLRPRLEIATAQFMSKQELEMTTLVIRRLSSDDLELHLRSLVASERRILHRILLFIHEISRRRIYLERSHNSLFDYLTKDIGYSASAAMRRINAAQLLAEIPDIAEHLQEGSLNLSQLGEVVRAVRDKEKAYAEPVATELKKQVLLEVRHKSMQQTQSIVAQSLDISPRRPDSLRTQGDESVLLHVSLSKPQFAKLKDSKERASHLLHRRSTSPSWSDLIELLAENFLGKYTIPHTAISKSVLRELLTRSQGCQHTDKQTGRICGSRYALQVDHIRPKWAGGDDRLENLQLLCGNHNRHKYEKEAGIQRG